MAEQVGSLKVQVAPGFAEDEFYVMVGNASAAFVSRDLVSVEVQPDAGSSVDGRVNVYVIDQSDDEALVELPGEAVVGGLRVRVNRSELLPAIR